MKQILMKNLCLILLIILMNACGTYRVTGDAKNQELTGVRTMISNWCVTASDCLENAIQKAKEECAQENKKYEYNSHHTGWDAQVKYKCL